MEKLTSLVEIELVTELPYAKRNEETQTGKI